ncbi:MAG: hypothetical protein NDI60_11220 [Elusimicrobiales bacterium]|nr:hypothetical protein [Elusimicrobiales bacterium]
MTGVLHTAGFDLGGCAASFSSGEKELTAWLAEDFGAFPSLRTGARARVSVTALQVPQENLRPAAPLLRTRRWSILPSPGGTRLVWYPEGALCEYDYKKGFGSVRAVSRDLLRELSYLLLLSRAGETLDLAGRHRLHAGALALGGKALLFCGAQGAGKTTLLLELLKDPAFSLLSDDTPLVSSDGSIHPFPARIGLGADSPHNSRFGQARLFLRRHHPPKRLIPAALAGTLCLEPARPWLLLRLVKGTAPALRRGSASAALMELLVSLAAGYGVPQMAEFQLRFAPSDAAKKAKILAARSGAALALLRRSAFYVFETGPDPAANAAALKAFLRSSSGRVFPS